MRYVAILVFLLAFPSLSCAGSAQVVEKILFVSTLNGDAQIYLTDSESNPQTALTSAPGENTQPAWSPDGRRIVFQRLSPGGKPAGIWSASPRDSGARLVVNRGTRFSIFESRRR